MLITFHNSINFTEFWPNKCSLGEHKQTFKKSYQPQTIEWYVYLK